jgi:hypothetical protein
VLRSTWNTQLLKSGSISLKIFYLFVANTILFFVLAIFVDGGAFPWGEIRGEHFLIVNNQGTREITENWFWFTYWQGFSAWIGIGGFLIFGSLYDLILTVKVGGTKGISGPLVMLVFTSIWVVFVSGMAYQIIA